MQKLLFLICSVSINGWRYVLSGGSDVEVIVCVPQVLFVTRFIVCVPLPEKRASLSNVASRTCSVEGLYLKPVRLWSKVRGFVMCSFLLL